MNEYDEYVKSIANLITDMTIKNADIEEIKKVIQHSIIAMDNAKSGELVLKSAIECNIIELRLKYQSGVVSTEKPFEVAYRVMKNEFYETRLDHLDGRTYSRWVSNLAFYLMNNLDIKCYKAREVAKGFIDYAFKLGDYEKYED